MATYVNDLRLQEIATGDESGTWGTSTNTNLELIAEAMGHGAEAVANASTHTITMADGATDQFRSTFLRLTGGGQACTVTLAPNTLSHTWIMRNETAAALTLTQGSGANVVIAAGQTKIVATDGAGSGAVVYEMDDLELAGNLVAASLDISGDIDVDGTTNLDIVDIDGAVNMATTALVTGVLTTTAATVFNGGFASNAASTITTADNTDTLSLISTDADANAGPNLRMFRNSASPADSDTLGVIEFEGKNDAGTTVRYAGIDSRIVDASDGTEDGRLELVTTLAGSAGISRLYMDATETVINDNSKDLDFRVESDVNTHTLFVEGSTGNVGIGAASPSSSFRTSIYGDGSSIIGGIEFRNATSGGATFTVGHASATSPSGTINVVDAGNLTFNTSNAERARFVAAGEFCVGTAVGVGEIANVQPVTAGRFRSFAGAQSAANNTATTMVTLPAGFATYIVNLGFNGVNNAGAYGATAIIHTDGTTTSLTQLVNPSNMTISLSGMAVQGTQTSGATLNISFSILRM